MYYCLVSLGIIRVFDIGAAVVDEPAAQQEAGAAGKRGKGRINRVPPPTPPGAEADLIAAEKRGRGRPAHEPTAESRRQVEAMAVRFLSRKGIAAVIGIGQDALRKYYAEELEVGDAKAELNVRTGLYKAAKKGNVQALIHLSKTKLGDSEKVQHEHSGPNGGSVQHFLAMPADQRRAHLEALAARVLAPPPDDAADGFETEH